MVKDLVELQKAIERKLDRLAEDCHDEIIKGHNRDGSGWAKILSPVIWEWFDREIEALFSAFQELSLAKETSLRRRLEDMKENLLRQIHAYGLRDLDEQMLVNSIELDIRHVFDETFTKKAKP